MFPFIVHIANNTRNNAVLRSYQRGLRMVSHRNMETILLIGLNDPETVSQFMNVSGAEHVTALLDKNTRPLQPELSGITYIETTPDEEWHIEANSIDMILVGHTLECVACIRPFLKQCHRILKNGGQFIVFTENLSSWANIAALLFGWQPFSLTGIEGITTGNPLKTALDDNKSPVHSSTGQHIHVLSYTGILDLLEQTGFRNNRAYTSGWFPFTGLISDILCKIDRRHGHLIIATGYKKVDIWKTNSK